MYAIKFYLVLLTTFILCLRQVRSSVSLTVEGGVSLVGPHCPGTIRLFCEGVDFPTFRWIYNGNIDIGYSYHSDAFPGTQTSTSNPAFVSIQLIAVSQYSPDPRFANFSSILSVNLSQLEQQKIKNISCGDPWIFDTVPVDVHIVHETLPAAPNFISLSVQLAAVLKNKSDSMIIILLVLWGKLRPVSDVFNVILSPILLFCY